MTKLRYTIRKKPRKKKVRLSKGDKVVVTERKPARGPAHRIERPTKANFKPAKWTFPEKRKNANEIGTRPSIR